MTLEPLSIPMDEELFNFAMRGLQRSYSPYSRFAVGAAVRTEGNLIFTGSNIENASYGLTLCAERVAIAKAVSEGHKGIMGLAIVADGGQGLPMPCGACRQMISEFTENIPIYVRNLLTNETKIFSSSDLLPEPFSLRHRGDSLA